VRNEQKRKKGTLKKEVGKNLFKVKVKRICLNCGNELSPILLPRKFSGKVIKVICAKCQSEREKKGVSKV
jgi:Zn finger protein HypA/HybF involved in hydrogenase expression